MRDKIRLLKRMSLVIMIFVDGWLLFYPLLRINSLIELDYNEGWNLYYQTKASLFQFLYDIQYPTLPLNYPPISFYVLGLLGRVWGNTLLISRLISLVSLLLISHLVFPINRERAVSPSHALFASLFLLAVFGLAAKHYIAMNDPQLFAQSLMVFALLYYVKVSRDDSIRPSALLVLSALCSLSLFMKHSLPAIPLSIGLDLWLKNKKDFLKYLLGSVFICLILFGGTYIFSGPAFIQFLTLKREYRLDRILSLLGNSYRPIFLIPIGLVLIGAVTTKTFKIARVESFYLLFSLILGFLSIGGSAIGISLFFDAFISGCLLIGLILEKTRSRLRIAITYLLLTFSMLVPSLMDSKRVIQEIKNLPKREEVLVDDTNFLRQSGGNAICERLFICYYAGKPFLYEPVMTKETLLENATLEEEVISRLATGHFQVIQLNEKIPDDFQAERFTKNFLRAVDRYYQLRHQSEWGWYYVYRGGPSVKTH